MDLATKEMLVDALKDFEGTMIFVSHDRMFLRGLGSRVLELGGESGTDRNPTVYPGSYVEYVQKLGHEAPGSIRTFWVVGYFGFSSPSQRPTTGSGPVSKEGSGVSFRLAC